MIVLSKKNKAFTKKILVLIQLTNIPAILCLPLFFKVCIGWILGTIASTINFIWLAHNVQSGLNKQFTKSKLNSIKGTYLRMLFLFAYSIIVFVLIKPNIVSFALGLLATQIILYLFIFFGRI